MDVKDSVVGTVMKYMPEGAEHYVTPTGGDYMLTIHWKLHTDASRPNKYSKTIIIAIPQELIEDFPSFPHELQESALEKIGQHIQNSLKDFDPDHDSPRGKPEPVVNWDIAIERLFG